MTTTQVQSNQKAQQLSASQRAFFFAQATRQYIQPLPSQNFVEGQTLSWDLPKARFLSRIWITVEGTFTATNAVKSTFDTNVFDKYNILRRISLSINNGYHPYSCSGISAYLYNLVNGYTKSPAPGNYNSEILETNAGVAGSVNTVRFTLELPVTINPRDTVGLILLQNEATIVTLAVDCDQLKNILLPTDTDTILTNINLKVTPVLETFSVPAIPQAIPDFSILKLFQEQKQNMVASGVVDIKLPTSLTYRKTIIYLAQDAIGNPIDPADISSFQLIFNQADIPYNIPATWLQYKNNKDYQGALPPGAYCFDFSSQGIANLGGGRDYIDTEKMTEFWLRINFSQIQGNNSYVRIANEMLAQLKA